MTVLSIWEWPRGDMCGKDRGSEVTVVGKEAREWPS